MGCGGDQGWMPCSRAQVPSQWPALVPQPGGPRAPGIPLPLLPHGAPVPAGQDSHQATHRPVSGGRCTGPALQPGGSPSGWLEGSVQVQVSRQQCPWQSVGSAVGPRPSVCLSPCPALSVCLSLCPPSLFVSASPQHCSATACQAVVEGHRQDGEECGPHGPGTKELRLFRVPCFLPTGPGDTHGVTKLAAASKNLGMLCGQVAVDDTGGVWPHTASSYFRGVCHLPVRRSGPVCGQAVSSGSLLRVPGRPPATPRSPGAWRPLRRGSGCG